MRWILALMLVTGLSGTAFAGDTTPSAPAATDAVLTPDDLVPPDASNVFKHQDNDGITVGYVTALDGEGLVAFYRPLLESHGWHFHGDFRNGQLLTYSLQKGDHGQGMLIAQRKGRQTTVMFSLKG
jgi:hypothetical protein